MRGNDFEENKVHWFLENLEHAHIRIYFCNYLTLTMLYNFGVKKLLFIGSSNFVKYSGSSLNANSLK